jgi:RNA polymerase sigma-70 factor, ECF subfamily
MKDPAEPDTDRVAVTQAPCNLPDSFSTATPASFESLYREHFAFVWRSLRGLGVEPASLDDATQDVFVVVHRQLSGFEQRSAPRTWIFAIAYNTASNYRRREYRKGGLVPMDPALPSGSPDPESELNRARAWDFVNRFLDGLDESKRAVFVLTQLEGMKATEVAEALGVPVNTVYSRIHHVRLSFREALACRDAGGADD